MKFDKLIELLKEMETTIEADFLENYVLACGIRGFARWNRPFASKLFSDEDVGRAEALRIRFIEEVGT